MSDSMRHPLADLLDALPFPAALVDDRAAILAANAELRRSGATDGGEIFDLFGAGTDAARGRFRDGMLRGVLDDSVVLERGADRDDPNPVRIHMRSLPVGADAFALLVVTPLPGEESLERRIDELEARLAGIGPIKHAIGNPLMGVLGYADLLRQSLGDAEQLRQAEAIAEQCRRIEECLGRLDALRYGEPGGESAAD